MEYNIGILYMSNESRLENNYRIRNIADFFKEVNALYSLKLNYIEYDSNFDVSNYPDIKIWITGSTDILEMVKKLFMNNMNIVLISLCDDNFGLNNNELKEYENIIHLNNSDIGQILQLSNILFKYIKSDKGGVFKQLYLFYDTNNIRYKNYFQSNVNRYESENVDIKYCNVDNVIEYDETYIQIITDVSDGIINNINTIFLYLTNDFETFFKIYSVVESPVYINNDTVLLSLIRHICSTNAYINNSYLDIYKLMQKYLIKNNFCIERDFELFFKKKLRMSIFAPILSKYEAQRYNYINYVFYIKNPVDATFIKDNRITIFSILMEKALKIAAWLSYRQIPSSYIFKNLEQRGILIDGKLFGPPNYNITKNPIDKYWYNRLVYFMYEPNILYYITNVIDISEKRSGIYQNISSSISNIELSLKEGISSISGNNFNM